MVCENLLYFVSQLVIIESIVEGLMFHCDYDQLLKFVVRLTPLTCWGQLQLIWIVLHLIPIQFPNMVSQSLVYLFIFCHRWETTFCASGKRLGESGQHDYLIQMQLDNVFVSLSSLALWQIHAKCSFIFMQHLLGLHNGGEWCYSFQMLSLSCWVCSIAKEKRECRIVAIRKQRVSTKISLDIYWNSLQEWKCFCFCPCLEELGVCNFHDENQVIMCVTQEWMQVCPWRGETSGRDASKAWQQVGQDC